MCQNLHPIADFEAIVFKVVAKKLKGTRYYSIAMGFMYPKKAGRIPKVKVQHRIGTYFDENILRKRSRAYADRMESRTAGFVNKKDADHTVSGMTHYDSVHGYDVLVVKARLTNELMSGRYGDHPVIAGRHIEFLE